MSLWHAKKLKHAYWRVRERFNVRTRSDHEVIYRLERERKSVSGSWQRTFRFPWGDFRYVSSDNLYGQFGDIFLRRQYAFSCDKPEPVIIDCGGNVGLSAIWFKMNYPRCHLTVYEADPDLATISRTNLDSAGFYDVQVKNEIVWISNGRVAFLKTGDDSGRITENSSILYPSIDLVDYLPACVDLLKLDIEGAEFAVLTKLCETGAIQRIKRLVCECHIWREKTDDFVRALALLRSSKMQLSMNAAAGPYLGLAAEEAPFEVIKRKQVLLELFAWHPPE
jgi:FkbM family methyltransferase